MCYLGYIVCSLLKYNLRLLSRIIYVTEYVRSIGGRVGEHDYMQ